MIGQEYQIKEINYYNDGFKLYADAYFPINLRGDKIGMAVIQGSGNSGRFNNWSRDFAEFLASNGYYVLLPDKRGSGESEGNWKRASYLELAQDAISSALTLKQMYGLDKIGVIGLSQGGKIAPVVACNSDLDFVINISGSAVSVEKQVIHEVTNSAINSGLAPEDVLGVLELHVFMKKYAFERDWTTLRNKFEEIKKSSWADFGMTFPHEKDSWIWDWVKINFNFNPMDFWPKVEQDVFIAYGTYDEKDNVPVYESVYLLQKNFMKSNKYNFEIKLYPTGHSLRSDNGKLSEEFQNDLLVWLRKR